MHERTQEFTEKLAQLVQEFEDEGVSLSLHLKDGQTKLVVADCEDNHEVPLNFVTWATGDGDVDVACVNSYDLFDVAAGTTR